MNNVFGGTQKKSVSTKNMIGAIGAIVCAVAALCMAFLPVFSVEGASSANENLFDYWGFGKLGEDIFKNVGDYFKIASESSGDAATLVISQIMVTYSATVGFFALILSAVFVAVGKLTGLRSGKKALAVVFSIIAFVMTAMLLVSVVTYTSTYNNNLGKYSVKVGVGVGPILMCVFALGAVIFSFISGHGGTSVTAPSAFVPPQPSGFNPQPQGMNSQFGPVAPQAYNPPAPQAYNPPHVPVPQMQPVPMVQPVPQNVVDDLDDDPPTVAQLGAIEGIKGDYASAVINMKPGEKLIIGRDPTCCNIVISSEKRDISRTHCSVKYDPYTDSFKVIDMSSNGTYVNGTRLVKDQETQFQAGTVLSLGSGENQFRLKKI